MLFTENAGGRPSEARIAVLSLATGKVRPLILGGTSPRYSRTGHVLFARGGRLYAVDFDSRLGEASGPERPLSARVITESFGTAQYAVGGNGVLAYIAGDPVSADHELVWVDRSGSARAVLHNTAGFRDPRLSPDGTRLALTIPEGPNWDVWILDLARGTLSRVTSHPGEDFSPVWSPDGQELVIGSEIGEDTGEGGPVMAWIRGSGERPEQLVASPGSGNWEFPTSWSPDGDWIAYVRIRNRSGDIFLFPTDRSREPVPFLETPNTNEFGARFSPDAKWIAYVSDETGERQVYVRSFPKPGRANLISTNGGVEPVWSKDGRELFYRNGDALIVVALGRGSELAPAVPRTLFRGRYEMSLWGGESANYDVSPDGQRFLMIRRKTPPTAQVVQVVLNWPAVLLEAR